MKKTLHAIFLVLLFIVFPLSCSKDGPGGGTCTFECGGFRFGTAFSVKSVRSTEEGCRKMAAEPDNGDCTIGYCPDTGNVDDCIRIK